MSDSNLPPIFASTEPTVIDNNTDQDDFDPSLMQSFRDEILSSFDAVAPRMSQLERTLSKTITISQTQRERSNFFFGDELTEVQKNLKEMHSQVIDMSRRVQSLALTTQSSSALAPPRLLRPVNEKFCDFKSEFDGSLKNLASLSGKITKKSQFLANSIESVSKLPSQISEMKKNISSYNKKIKQHEKTINELRGKALRMVEESETNICEDLKKQITDAENMLKEMEESAQKGESEADTFSQKMQDDKESLRQSFSGLTQDIEKVTNGYINKLNSDIKASSKKSVSLMESIQNQLSNEIEQLIRNFSYESESPLMDQLNQAHEEAQLLSLMTRLEKLQEQIKNFDQEEIFTAVVDGETIKYYCKADGTFHT